MIIGPYRTLRFAHVEMFPSTAGDTTGQNSSVSSLKQRRFVIIKGNVVDKTSALLSSYIVIFAFSM